jgi:23S rRNA pseudouridine2604 synthase
LLRVENGHEKEYRVTVDKPVTDEFLAAMSRGVRVLGQKTRAARTERIGRDVFGIVLTQGLNRQIRRMCTALGYRVRRLERTRIVNITLAGLSSGRWRSLTRSELAGLLPERFGG